jgi:uncharacterized protein (DUF924 family)
VADVDPEDVLAFWFEGEDGTPQGLERQTARWFGGGADFDEAIRARFAALPERARRGELEGWGEQARSALALVLVLDQFPRNLHRGSDRAFAYDAAARTAAEAALTRGFDRALRPVEAVFLYLPLEHAEDRDAQARCVALYRALAERAPAGTEESFRSFVDYAERHRAVIERFGRFPHRNEVLGRPSTAEEIEYLGSGGETFSGGGDRE